MRFNYRTGRNSSVSVGLIGGLILLVMLAAVWFYIAVAVFVILAVAAVIAVIQRRKDLR